MGPAAHTPLYPRCDTDSSNVTVTLPPLFKGCFKIIVMVSGREKRAGCPTREGIRSYPDHRDGAAVSIAGH